MLKAITLHQPYASLMALGEKRNETRNRRTHWRGDVAICSSKKPPKGALDRMMSEPFASALGLYELVRDHGTIDLDEHFPCGYVLCVVEFFHCQPTTEKSLCLKCAGQVWAEAIGGVTDGPCMECGKITALHTIPAPQLTESERAFGDYSEGRYIWRTGKLRLLKDPVPVKGKQGWFYLPADVEARVRAQL